MPNPKPAQSAKPKAAPPFAKAPPRRTIIEELVTQSTPTKDLVYEPEYKLVHTRVPGASFGKPVSGPVKKRRGSGTASNNAGRPTAERSILDSLCRNSSAKANCSFGEKRSVSLEEQSEDNETDEEKSALGPGSYDVDLKSVQKRVPNVGFATMVPREEPGKARRTEEGQLLTLDLTRALGAVSKRVKGVVGFGSGPPRFVEEDDKENQTKVEVRRTAFHSYELPWIVHLPYLLLCPQSLRTGPFQPVFLVCCLIFQAKRAFRSRTRWRMGKEPWTKTSLLSHFFLRGLRRLVKNLWGWLSTVSSYPLDSDKLLC